MANFGDQVKLSGLVASGDLSSYQYRFVKAASTAGAVKLATSATANVLGVLQNDPTSGQAASVCALGETKVHAAAALTTWGGTITVNGSGYAIASQGTAGTVILGRNLEVAAVSGDLVKAFINCAGSKY